MLGRPRWRSQGENWCRPSGTEIAPDGNKPAPREGTGPLSSHAVIHVNGSLAGFVHHLDPEADALGIQGDDHADSGVRMCGPGPVR